jgi:hypothetical protein
MRNKIEWPPFPGESGPFSGNMGQYRFRRNFSNWGPYSRAVWTACCRALSDALNEAAVVELRSAAAAAGQ